MVTEGDGGGGPEPQGHQGLQKEPAAHTLSWPPSLWTGEDLCVILWKPS